MIRALMVGATLLVTPANAQKPDDRWAQILSLIMIAPNPIHRESCNERLKICSEVWASQDVLGKHIMAAKRFDKAGKLLYREVCRFEQGDMKRTCIDIDTEQTTVEIRIGENRWEVVK